MKLDGSTSFVVSAEFRPELFFLGRTEGGGVVKDPLGRVLRRCEILTEGRFVESRQAIQFSEIFSYDDGEIDIWRWVMARTRDGRYVAAEEAAGPGVQVRRVDKGYKLSFRRPVGPLKGLLAPSFVSYFTSVTPELLLKSAKISLLGVPLGSLQAVHRRVSP